VVRWPQTSGAEIRRPRSSAADRGFALIVVLWMLVLVTLLVTQLTSSGRTEAQLATNLRTRAVLQSAADGAVYDAVFHLLDQSERHWPADGASHALNIGGTAIAVRIDSEAGKINPNTAPPELLNALLRRVGADRRTAALVTVAITTWRSSPAQTSTVARRLDAAYRAAGRDYLPPYAPFQSINELGLVLGMTPQLLAQLAPHLSIYRNAAPDPASADSVVTAALADWSGLPPTAKKGPRDENLVMITASAHGLGGARMIRRALVQIDGANSPFRVLNWDDHD
jgi:general secretion pathway protein K